MGRLFVVLLLFRGIIYISILRDVGAREIYGMGGTLSMSLVLDNGML